MSYSLPRPIAVYYRKTLGAQSHNTRLCTSAWVEDVQYFYEQDGDLTLKQAFKYWTDDVR